MKPYFTDLRLKLQKTSNKTNESLRQLAKQLQSSLLKRTVTVLTVAFCLASLIFLVHIYNATQQLVENQALEYAINAASALKKARLLYNSAVVSRISQLDNIKAVHDYLEYPDTIPLPATYLRELGHQISESDHGMNVRLYSDYPFPWREEEGGVKDKFEQEALDFLRLNPERSFYRFEQFKNQLVLRYTEADIMKPQCISCHNTYPGTPKTDWKVGDLRGIVEISLSLTQIRQNLQTSLKTTLLILFLMSMIGIVGLTLSIRHLYSYSLQLEKRVEIRQNAMEQVFSAIHNGPLQTLALLLREVQQKNFQGNILWEKLKGLDTEIREVGSSLTQENLGEFQDNKIIRLGQGTCLQLNRPIHELFYEIYTLTLQRNFPYFSRIKIKVRDFEPLEMPNLSLEDKQKICRWLEEALCNIGKHAQGVTRVIASGKYVEGWYILKVQDNGSGIMSNLNNQGTKHATKLAQSLGGHFTRESLPKGGTVCQLSWPVNT